MGFREYVPVPGTGSFRDVDRIPRLIDAHLRQDEDSHSRYATAWTELWSLEESSRPGQPWRFIVKPSGGAGPG
jgi:hypothetical protein